MVKTTPIRCTWFEKFMIENKKQTLSIKRDTFVLSRESLRALLEYVEGYWLRIKAEEQRN